MLRHPAAVIDSKQRWYGGWQGEVGRGAGWLNQTLFMERATREMPRVVIRYDDLLEDWTREVGRAGEALDLDAVRDALAGGDARACTSSSTAASAARGPLGGRRAAARAARAGRRDVAADVAASPTGSSATRRP